MANRKLTYDRSNNVVILHVQDEVKGEDKTGMKGLLKTKSDIENTFSVEGIRNAWKQTNERINAIEKQIKDLKIKKYPKIDFDENSLRLLKEQLTAIQTIDQKDKDKQQLESLEKNLKSLKKDKLELEPVVKKLPKK